MEPASPAPSGNRRLRLPLEWASFDTVSPPRVQKVRETISTIDVSVSRPGLCMGAPHGADRRGRLGDAAIYYQRS